MRDIKRIKPIVARLTKCWEEVPDLRLGQLMIYIINAVSAKKGVDPFYMEDDEFIEEVEKILGKDNCK